MPILSGYSGALPTDVLLGTMVISMGGTATAYGATKNEPVVNLPHEYDNMDFDGKMGVPIAGLDRRVMKTIPSIEGTFIEMNDTKALDLEPGGASSGTTVKTITPANVGDFLTAPTHYKQDVLACMRRGNGKIFAIYFPLALLLVDTITPATMDEGLIRIRLEARQDPAAASLGVVPYKLLTGDTIAAIVTEITA